MATAASNSLLQTKSILPTHPLLPSSTTQCYSVLGPKPRPIQSVHAADNPVNVVTDGKQQQPRHDAKWAVDSWKSKKALQLPEYPNQEKLQAVLKSLETFPPIVFAGEARNLEERLADAAVGKAFLLQGGDCAESFKEFNANNIRDTFRILLQMSVVMMFGGQMPVIKVGRMAGQFAKPRSEQLEEKNGVKLPSYRGDNVNGDAFEEKARIPDPERMIRAYSQSAATLNLLRAFATGGYAAMQRVGQWNLDFTEHSEQGDRNMQRALLSKNKLKFVNGSIKTPLPTDPNYEAWERCNVMILSWIMRTLAPDIAESVMYIDSAKELWEELRERFSQGDYFQISDLLQEIHSIRQGDRSISQFFTELKKLWEELEFLRPIPNCTCGKPCECDLSKVFLKQRETEHAICFLKGLNDNYNSVRTQILLMEPLPNINKVFSLVMQQERKGNGSGNLANENKVLMNTADKGYRNQEQASWRGQGRGNGSRAQGRGRGRNPNQGKQCTYCHKMNHTAEECYSKHGYPPWYKQRTEQDKGSYSNKNSNTQQMCNLNVNPESQKSSDHTPEEGTANTTLSIEQIQRLLKLLDDKDEPKHSVSHIQSFSNNVSTHKNQQDTGQSFIQDDWAC